MSRTGSHRIVRFEEIDSTHAYAVEHGGRLVDGDVVLADFQRAGRGRLSRSWSAPKGKALLFSIVLKPCVPPERWPLITPVLSVALARALDEFGVESRIVWPNDLVARGGKIAGVLAEAAMEGGRPAFAVAGAGVNVAQGEAELASTGREAASIFTVTGRIPDRDELMDAVLDRFDSVYGSFLQEGFSAVADEWRMRMALEGETIELDFGDRRVKGRVEGFGDDGSIIIEHGPGRFSSHSSGEVLRLSGPCQGAQC